MEDKYRVQAERQMKRDRGELDDNDQNSLDEDSQEDMEDYDEEI
jgi:hypothetical protein